MQSAREKWAYTVKRVNSVVFVVDLVSYDYAAEADSATTEATVMSKSLAEFKSIGGEWWTEGAATVLYLTNKHGLEQKLASSPLSNWFPDYTDRNNHDTAAAYIAWQFQQLSLLRPSYALVREPTSMHDLRQALAIGRNAMVQRTCDSDQR